MEIIGEMLNKLYSEELEKIKKSDEKLKVLEKKRRKRLMRLKKLEKDLNNIVALRVGKKILEMENRSEELNKILNEVLSTLQTEKKKEKGGKKDER